MNKTASGISRVLITRPREQADDLAAMLATMGIESIVLPALEFRERRLEGREREELAALGGPLLLVFTSPRAVEFGLHQLPRSVIESSRLAAIGPSTAQALAAMGVRTDVQPAGGHTSEALLASLVRQDAAAPGDALLVSAPGGRDRLAEGLSELGWRVRPVWVYQRRAAEVEPAAVEAIERADELVVVFTSAEAMNSLSRRLRPAAWYAVCRGQWLVISERLRRLARAFGPPVVHVADGPRNTDLATAIRSIA